MKKQTFFVLAAALSLVAPLSAMTNADVVKMANAGLGADIIVSTVRNATDKQFDTSVDALVALKTAKVPDPVIAAIMSEPSSAPAPDAATPSPTTTAAAPAQALKKGLYFIRGSAVKRASTIAPSEVKKPFATFNPNYKVKVWFNGATGAHAARAGDRIVVSGWDLRPLVAKLKVDGARRLALLKPSGNIADEDLVNLDFTRDGNDNWVATIPAGFPTGEYWVLVPTPGDESPAADFSVR